MPVIPLEARVRLFAYSFEEGLQLAREALEQYEVCVLATRGGMVGTKGDSAVFELTPNSLDYIDALKEPFPNLQVADRIKQQIARIQVEPDVTEMAMVTDIIAFTGEPGWDFPDQWPELELPEIDGNSQLPLTPLPQDHPFVVGVGSLLGQHGGRIQVNEGSNFVVLAPKKVPSEYGSAELYVNFDKAKQIALFDSRWLDEDLSGLYAGLKDVATRFGFRLERYSLESMKFFEAR